MTPSELPAHIEGFGPVRPFSGVEPPPAVVTRAATRVCPAALGADKLLRDIDAAFDACGIGDGATLSFHHHLRNGDQVLNQVLAVAARRGLRDLRIAASSLFAVHAPLVEHMRCRRRDRGSATAYVAGPVAEALSRGRAGHARGDADPRRAGAGDRVRRAAHRRRLRRRARGGSAGQPERRRGPRGLRPARLRDGRRRSTPIASSRSPTTCARIRCVRSTSRRRRSTSSLRSIRSAIRRESSRARPGRRPIRWACRSPRLPRA